MLRHQFFDFHLLALNLHFQIFGQGLENLVFFQRALASGFALPELLFEGELRFDVRLHVLLEILLHKFSLNQQLKHLIPPFLQYINRHMLQLPLQQLNDLLVARDLVL